MHFGTYFKITLKHNDQIEFAVFKVKFIVQVLQFSDFLKVLESHWLYNLVPVVRRMGKVESDHCMTWFGR